ncbi:MULTISPECIES: alpha/beta fold hydrolase [Paraburkholderia]|uniref:Alpha/beta fold hydrolase n=1 Tax=Paraburkholderia madseniana TaxID=2599607 RepID=A0A6N6WEC1_9BURK|nr:MULTISPECIES: alpha/beta fold hydrolase [Paraburkholderia]KAE8758339.1 alpha/beta fold hydrolase [Paraburkholderia madseniana]MCX4172153.1 alpha/beta fold hydrolase [Paraburkholderia madseniana]MDQ6460162.1 alpha/beta fold hydrolase [Paraburkholderia madseniana]NPT65607.1 alpha/beta fold hydrolase [Paraburkholderia madseniana]
MRPVLFDGRFGWLHPAEGPGGVVLCSPFGYDALCTYRGMRRLAERLAARGMPVLRFDYPGTGDAAGEASEPGRWRAWIDSIKQAVALLRETTGVERVTLCGLRLGGTLAALAAQELGGVDGLVMLAPVLSGKNYQRELRAHYRKWLLMPAAMDCEAEPDTDAFVEAYGFRLYSDTLESLRAVDLRRDAARPAERVLVLDSLDPARVDALVAHYREQGMQVERQSFDEYGKFMMESLDSAIPRAAFQSIEDWLAGAAGDPVARERLTAGSGADGMADCLADQVSGHMAERLDDHTTGHIVEPGVVETPVWLEGGRMSGIYCVPVSRSDAEAPAVLMVNTGAVSRIGNARLSVRCARRLARQGIASLRVDLGGLGDSQPSLDAVSLDALYAQAGADDAACAARWLTAQGHRGAVLLGICAGAFVGLHAASREPAVIGAVLVNLQKFTWQNICDEHGKPTVPVAAFGSTRNYLRSMCQPRKWLRVVRGQTGGLPVARELAARFAARFGATLADRIERICAMQLGSKDEQRLFTALHARGVHTRLFYGVLDEGVEELERYFGARGGRLRRFGRIGVTFCERTDHAILSARAQENVMSYFEDFFANTFGEGHQPEPSIAVEPLHARLGWRHARATQWLLKRARALRLSGEAQ